MKKILVSRLKIIDKLSKPSKQFHDERYAAMADAAYALEEMGLLTVMQCMSDKIATEVTYVPKETSIVVDDGAKSLNVTVKSEGSVTFSGLNFR